MLTSLDIILASDEDKRLSPHIGSLLHGAIMQQVEPSFAEYLHGNHLKPYSQFVYFDRDNKQYIWKINTINDESKDKIINLLITNLNGKVNIEHKNCELLIEKKILNESVSYSKLAEEYYLKKPFKRKVVIKFLTPASFKAGGKYIIFPEIYNVYNSLLNKWNSFATEVSLKDEHILDHLKDHTEMIGYNLRSTKFELEGTRIHSFRGEICLHINGPESLVRIANLLFAFGEYSGIGVKCALGMGGIKVG